VARDRSPPQTTQALTTSALRRSATKAEATARKIAVRNRGGNESARRLPGESPMGRERGSRQRRGIPRASSSSFQALASAPPATDPPLPWMQPHQPPISSGPAEVLCKSRKNWASAI